MSPTSILMTINATNKKKPKSNIQNHRHQHLPAQPNSDRSKKKKRQHNHVVTHTLQHVHSRALGNQVSLRSCSSSVALAGG